MESEKYLEEGQEAVLLVTRVTSDRQVDKGLSVWVAEVPSRPKTRYEGTPDKAVFIKERSAEPVIGLNIVVLDEPVLDSKGIKYARFKVVVKGEEKDEGSKR